MIPLLIALSLTAAPDRVVAGTGLRLRAQPSADAAVVDKAPLGTVLTCLEESKPVTAGGKTAPFCKTKTQKGDAWYFTALTEVAESNKNAQLERVAKKAAGQLGDDLGLNKERWPDVYEVHNVMKSLPGLAAKIEETRFVARYPHAFMGDPRVQRDYAQGPRVTNETFAKLVEEARGKPEHEAAAFARYEHGLGGECEGQVDCMITAERISACTYLSEVPSGAHAGRVVDNVATNIAQQREWLAKSPFPEDDASAEMRRLALDELATLRTCVEKPKASEGKRALTSIDAFAAALKK